MCLYFKGGDFINEFVNAYDILTRAFIQFCEHNENLYDDIVVEIFTDVLGHDYIYCKCVGSTFEFLSDWYEGGNLEIINIDYFMNICDKVFHNIKE